MRVGLTYDLRDDYLAEGLGREHAAEFDRRETIEQIASELTALGHECDRIGNIHSLTKRLAMAERWDLVFNIAEGRYGVGREAQVPALLEAYGIPYTFSDTVTLSLTMHKGLTKRVVRDMGIPTPDFAVVECAADVETIKLPFPLFVKPIAEGTSKGISSGSLVQSQRELSERCASLLAEYRQPVIVEEFLPGREFTVGIIGTCRNARALGVMEILLGADADKEIYTYDNKAQYESRVRYRLIDEVLATKAEELALRAWRGLGCRDAGRVDLRCDAQGIVNFLEVNPLPGLDPEHSDLPILCSMRGIAYSDLIQMIVESAIERQCRQ